MIEAGRRWAWTFLLAGAVIFSGCAIPTAEIVLHAPVVEREPVVKQEPTLLERFQEVSRLCEAERIHNASLTNKLAERNEAYKCLDAELQSLREKTKVLEKNAKDLADLTVKYGEAQKTLLQLGKTVRSLRNELLQERLARIKQEQKVVALKLNDARGRRKMLLENGESRKEKAAQEGTHERAAQPSSAGEATKEQD